MKLFVVLLVSCFIQLLTMGQSPFNFGQNKKIYFIPTTLRDKLDIRNIYIVQHLPDNEKGGMGENWDVTLIQFSSKNISDDWYPISKDKSYKYNFGNLTRDMVALNGSSYELSNGKVSAYGGNGYGSFDWRDITHISDSVLVVAKSCQGHCGDQPVNYSKNVFNKKGQLIYIVFYPTPTDELNNDSEQSKLSYIEYEKFLNSGVSEDHLNDTLFYKYDNKGLLLNVEKDDKINNSTEAKRLFEFSADYIITGFYQCYIENIKMENFVLKKLGYLPELILIEIDNYGVFTFSLNNKSKKYYRSREVMLVK